MRTTRRPPAPLALALIVSAAGLTRPIPVSAQASAECALATDCAPGADPARSLDGRNRARQRLWTLAVAVHQHKLPFVAAVQRFTRAQAGTFGDEGAELVAALQDLQSARAAWDAAIASFDAEAARLPGDTDADLARATVYLDRQRVADARRVLAGATGAEERVDLPSLRALAAAAAGRREDALKAFKQVTARAPDTVTAWYGAAQQAAALGQRDEAQRALQGFVRALRQVRTPPGAAPFERADLLRQASGVAPLFAMDGYAAGYDLLRAGDYEEALAHFGAAVQRDPLVRGEPALRARVAQGAALLRSGSIRAAISLLAATAATAGDTDAHRVLGLAYLADQQHDKAVASFDAALALDPSNDRARMALVDALRARGEEDRAAQLLGDSVAAGGGSGSAHYVLGEIARERADLSRAAAELAAAAARPPVVGQDHLLATLGRVRVNQADFDGAVAAYTSRVEVNPNSAEAHVALAEIYFLQGRHEEALAEFACGVFLEPGNAAALAGLGKTFARLERHADAVDALTRAVEREPSGDRERYYVLGSSLLRLGRDEDGRRALAQFQALQAEEAARQARDFDLDARRRAAAALVSEGRAAQAVPLLRDLAALDPQSPRSYRELGAALRASGDSAGAIEQFERAQALAPELDTFGALADAYRALGRHADADRQGVLRDSFLNQQKRAWIQQRGGERR